MRKEKNYTLFYIIISILFAIMVINLVRNYTEQKERTQALTSRLKTGLSLPEKQKLPAPIPPSIHLPEPSRPEEYGLVVYPDSNKPNTESEWNTFVNTSFESVKTSMPLETKMAIESIKIDKEAFSKRQGEINSRIEDFKKILEANPSDEEAKMRLQKLYILKSIGETFEKEGLVKE